MTAIKPETSVEKKVDLDDVLKYFSAFGRYHMQCMVLVFIACIFCGMNSSNFIFTATEVHSTCVDEAFLNESTINSTAECKEWVYDDPHSFVAEFKLAGQEWKRTLVGTANSFGYMIGLVVIGFMSDRWGRKTILIITGVTGGVLGLTKSFVPWYWVYIVLEALEAAFGDCFSPTYVLNIEMVSSKIRVFYFVICGFGFSAGVILLSLIAWAIPYWRNYLRVFYPPAILLFFYTFLLDESPRWLLTNGKKEKAVAVLEKAAAKNKITIDKKLLENLACEKEKADTSFMNALKLTFSSRILLQRCAICIIWWMASTFIYYGMSINSVSLEGNKYINFALTSFVDVPATIASIFILKKFNRRRPLIFGFFVGAIFCLIQPFLPTNMPWLSLLVYLAGKLMASFFFDVTYIYTTELFPTHTRNSMHALCSSVGRLGGMLAPQTPLLTVYWSGMPSLVFGGAALLAGTLTFFVPDISEDSLPDTVNEAEALDKNLPNQVELYTVSTDPFY